LKRIGGSMPLDRAVKDMIRGIEADQFLIIPGVRAKLVHWALRLTPLPLWNLITDTLIGRTLHRRRPDIADGDRASSVHDPLVG
jgi:hypothetical protein